MWKRFLKICCCFMIISLIDYAGIFKHLYEVDYKYFTYPAERSFTKDGAGYRRNYSFIYTASDTRHEKNPPFLLFLVKSAIQNTKQRSAIRKTWGAKQQDISISTGCVFLIGASVQPDDMQLISKEALQHNDIVQIDFLDTYFNNTIKTIMGWRWALEYKSNTQYYMFVDDDYFVSVKNVLSFIQKQVESDQTPTNFFAGYVMQTSPHRHKFSKWYVSLEEYPFHLWPPYVTAGAYILSNSTLKTLYETSINIPYFRYDDIYMGIVALEANVTLTNSNRFYFHRPNFNEANNCRNVIASHGFNNPADLVDVWKMCM